MAIDFPDSPSVNDTYVAGGKTYKWDGTAWEIYGPNFNPDILYTDTTNNRVGINNTSPTVDLDVTGDVSMSGTLAVGLNADVEASIDAVETDITNINELQINNPLTSYTLALTDSGKLVQPHSASANNLTIPPNSSVAFPIGTQILVVQVGAGQVTLVEGSGVLIESKDGNKKLSAQFSAVTLIHRATDVWLAIGDLSA